MSVDRESVLLGAQRGTRRRFVAGAIAGSAVAVVRAPAKAAQFEFKCGSDLQPDQPSSVRLHQMWAQIEKESGGRIRTQFYPAASLGSMASMFSQVRVGALHFLLIGPANLAAVAPAMDICSLGFAFKDADEGMRVMLGPLGGYLRAEVEAKGIRVMPAFWLFGMNHISSSIRAIRVPDDARGLKIRVPESKIAVDLWRALGANPTPLSVSEIYTALQTKLVDGQASPLVIMETAHFYEVQKYISLTNHALSGTWLISNGDVWKSLPPDLQAIVERNTTKYALTEQRDMRFLNQSLADKLARQGMAVNSLDTAPFRAQLRTYYQYWATAFGPTAWGHLQTSLGHTLV